MVIVIENYLPIILYRHFVIVCLKPEKTDKKIKQLSGLVLPVSTVHKL